MSMSDPPLEPHPRDAARQAVAGPDPDRVLLVGSGPVLGPGVLTQELALPGQLARRVAAATGRGAVVDVHALRGATAASLPGLLGGVRLTQYDAVLVCVGSVEAHQLLLPPGRWRADLARTLAVLRAATTPSTVLAVLPIRPLRRPVGAVGRAGPMVDRHAQRMDRLARDACAAIPGTVHLTPADELLWAPRSPAEYDDLAAAVTPLLADRLDRLAASAAPGTPRSLRAQPDDETDRQLALDRSGLLGGGGSAQVDRLLQHARDRFRTTGAAVTLVDGDRVVFAAAVGLPTDDVARTVAPCDRTIRQQGALVLEDLRGEPLARDGWRFYAGYPLESPDGYRIGALCLLGREPRGLDAADRVAFADIAARIESALGSLAASPV